MPDKLDIVIDKNSPDILEKLEEAIMIISMKKEIITVNPTMSKLLNRKAGNEASAKDLCYIITGDECALDNWLNVADSECVYLINQKYYLINTLSVPNRGVIITASDINEEVTVQRELEKSIYDLKELTKTLQLYSIDNEISAVRKERQLIYNNIQDLIAEGLDDLNKELLKIKNKPPENYDSILNKSRSLLNKIRTIVSNWRSITGADI